VILHTNLGRAPLAQSAIDAIQRVAGGYSNLEYDLSTGGRGKRQFHIEEMVAQVIGAPAAMVVNNAASAVLLTLSALAKDRAVVISRGQLVEIGGGFRIPDVMAQSGALMVEVGTTNRTRLDDYARAIDEGTALLMRAHSSNFKILGFTEEVPLADMASLAHQHGLLCVDDLGSGALLDTADFGLSHEPTVAESLAAGVDAVMFSGDKLLGGPQAGIIAGEAAVLDRLKSHPLARAVRVDKLTIAALVATLDHYRRGQAVTHIPIWQMIAKPIERIEAEAKIWADVLPGDLLKSESTVGGGSLPGETLPTVVYAPRVASPQDAQAALRAYDPPIIARVKDERLLLDPRTVLPNQITMVAAALGTL
jgi:L-seryl-tRNA(Ser) seleniumtransferase